MYSQKYRNFDSDRALKHNLVTINERDVDKVKERIRKEDFDILLDSIYRSIIICEDNSFKKEVKMFVDSYKTSMDIKLNNVISIHRGDESSNRYFFIIKVDSDGYRCVVMKKILLSMKVDDT